MLGLDDGKKIKDTKQSARKLADVIDCCEGGTEMAARDGGGEQTWAELDKAFTEAEAAWVEGQAVEKEDPSPRDIDATALNKNPEPSLLATPSSTAGRRGRLGRTEEDEAGRWRGGLRTGGE